MKSKLVVGSIKMIILLATGVVSFYLGHLSSSFDNNLCYNEVIQLISKQAIKSIGQGTDESSVQFQNYIDSLPLYGYENSCRDLLRPAKEYASNE